MPTVTFEEGFSKTIDWYLNNPKWLEKVFQGSIINIIKDQYLLK